MPSGYEIDTSMYPKANSSSSGGGSGQDPIGTYQKLMALKKLKDQNSSSPSTGTGYGDGTGATLNRMGAGTSYGSSGGDSSMGGDPGGDQ